MDISQFSPCWLLIFLSLVSAGLALPTQIVNGTFGGSINFDVSVPFPAHKHIEWFFGETGNVTMIVQRFFGRILYHPQYRGKCELFVNGTLRLDNLTYADEGHYCFYGYDDNLFSKDIIPYDLTLFPALYTPSLSILSDRIVDGTNVTLQCDSSNPNVTTYTFYRDQKPICSEPHVTCSGSFLVFTPITENDSGSYTCTIQNPVSSNTSNSIVVSVSVPVSEVTLTSNTSDLLLWPGRDSVSLRCSSKGTNVSYSWSMDGAPLPLDPRFTLNNSTLVISPVLTKDIGYFMCTAKNWINSENSTRLYLNMAAPVSAVIVTRSTSGVLWAGRDSVSLYCSAQGSAITFSWSLNGNPISPKPPYYITQSDSPPNSNLTISPVSRNDTGPFICTATNLANSDTTNPLNLALAWEPEGNIICLAKSDHDEHVMLGCSWPGGNPPANVTMTFNNTLKSATTNVTKIISSSSILQGSNLTCHGEQMGKPSSCTEVLDPPQSQEHNNSAIINKMEGETTVMTLTLKRGLPAQFTWFSSNPYRIQVPVQAGGKFRVESNSTTSSLLVSQAAVSDSGIYSCRAVNIIGSETFNFNLNVTAQATLHTPSLSIISDRIVDGTNVTLQCDSRNPKVTTFTFYRDQKPICSEPHVTCSGSFLVFTPITENDSGSYTCTIQNPVSSNTSNSIVVTVSVPVSEVTLTSNTSDLLLWPGRDSVSLRCSSKGTNVSYSWSLDGAPLPQDPRFTLNNSTLIISPVLTKDIGYVLCTARSWINSGNSTRLYLNMAAPVSAVTVTRSTSGVLWAGRDSVSLYCSAQGSAITFSWSLNGNPISPKPPYDITQSDSPPNSNLTITPVSRKDTGPFICTATNLANSETTNPLNLALEWEPEGNVICLAKSDHDEHVMLGCSWPGGNPPANVTMTFNNTLKSATTNVTKIVSSSIILQGSTLTCHGEQMGKPSSCTEVLDPPQSQEHNNSAIINKMEGETTVMTLTLKRGLPAQFTWFSSNPYRIQVPVQTGGKFRVESNSTTSSLLVSQAAVSDSGIYSCRAVNIIGSETFNFKLNVTAQASVSQGMSRDTIALIVIGVLAALIIILIVMLIFIKKRSRQKVWNLDEGNSTSYIYTPKKAM